MAKISDPIIKEIFELAMNSGANPERDQRLRELVEEYLIATVPGLRDADAEAAEPEEAAGPYLPKGAEGIRANVLPWMAQVGNVLRTGSNGSYFFGFESCFLSDGFLFCTLFYSILF